MAINKTIIIATTCLILVNCVIVLIYTFESDQIVKIEENNVKFVRLMDTIDHWILDCFLTSHAET